MIGNLEPEETVMSQKNIMISKLESIIQSLGWNDSDDIVVDVGGVSSSGIHQVGEVNPKWAKPYGTISYQNDAFIVIKNRTRNPVVPSIPNSDIK